MLNERTNAISAAMQWITMGLVKFAELSGADPDDTVSTGVDEDYLRENFPEVTLDDLRTAFENHSAYSVEDVGDELMIGANAGKLETLREQVNQVVSMCRLAEKGFSVTKEVPDTVEGQVSLAADMIFDNILRAATVDKSLDYWSTDIDINQFKKKFPLIPDDFLYDYFEALGIDYINKPEGIVNLTVTKKVFMNWVKQAGK